MALSAENRAPEAGQARAVLELLTRARDAGQPVRLTAPGGRAVEVPPEVVDLLLQILDHLTKGAAVTVVPQEAELTTQQAADILNVSRPYMVRLLDGGRIPFHRAGTHRRVHLADLLAYKQERDAKSREAVREMTELAQKHRLGY